MKLLLIYLNLKMPPKPEKGQGGSSKVNDVEPEYKCSECSMDIGGGGGGKKSIKCDFCNNWYCMKCTKLKQSLFNEIGKESSILWTCIHCKKSLPGIMNLMSKVSSLESKLLEMERKFENLNGTGNMTTTTSVCTDKELIREVLREEKMEESELEARKLNIIVHSLKESDKQTLEQKKTEDYNIVMKILNDELSLDVDVDNVIRLGRLTSENGKPRPLRFTVRDNEVKRRVMNSCRNLKTSNEYSSVFFTPDLTQNQRKEAFLLRESKRQREREGEHNLIIRRGKIITKPTTGDHVYSQRRDYVRREESSQHGDSAARSPPREGGGRNSFH